MYAVEFEADVTSPFIHLQNYEQFMNQHVKVIVLAQDSINNVVSSVSSNFRVADLTSFNKGRKQQDFSRMDAYDDAI
jgi:hypothetical protein